MSSGRAPTTATPVAASAEALAFPGTRRARALRVSSRSRSRHHPFLRRRHRLTRRHHGRSDGQELHEVFRKDEIQSPVDRDAALLLEPGKLAQVDRPPEPPREEAGKVESKDARHAGPATDRGEL